MKKLLSCLMALLIGLGMTCGSISANEIGQKENETQDENVLTYGKTIEKSNAFYYGNTKYTLKGKYYISVNDVTGELETASLKSWTSNIPGTPYTKCEQIGFVRNSKYRITLTIKIYIMSIFGDILDSDTIDVAIDSTGPQLIENLI